jgi:hypothetical protein
MPFHHDSHIRPTADAINRYATALLAAEPGMKPLDAVRLALQSAERDAQGLDDREPPRTAMPAQRRDDADGR